MSDACAPPCLAARRCHLVFSKETDAKTHLQRQFADHTFVCRYNIDAKNNKITKGFAEDPRGDDAPEVTADLGGAAPQAAPGAAPEVAPEATGDPAVPKKAPRFDAKKHIEAQEARLDALEPLVGLITELQEKVKQMDARLRELEP